MQQAENYPGYEFQLQQGEQALSNQASASGELGDSNYMPRSNELCTERRYPGLWKTSIIRPSDNISRITTSSKQIRGISSTA